MKKNIGFLFSFCLAKGMVFLAPILLADILIERDFGVVEYSLAGVGMLVNAVINLGVPGAYPYFILRKQNLKIKNGFSLHPLWLLLFFIINQILYFGFNLFGLEIFMAINVSYIIANQQFLSVKLKSHEHIFRAVFLDAGLYVLLMIFVIGGLTGIMKPTIYNINLGVLIYGFFFGIYAIGAFVRVKKDYIFARYFEVLKFSSHLLLSTFFLFLLTVSGRILTKHFFDYETTGIYGYYYRLAAIVVMIYQVVSIRYFKDIYTLNPRKLDKYFAYFYAIIFGLSVILYFISPHVMPYVSDYFSETYTPNKEVFFVIFCQMTMWIATALNSNIVDREGLAKKNNSYYLVLLGISVLGLYILKDQFNLLGLTFAIYTIFFMANLSQFLTLYQKKIVFKKSAFTLAIIYTLSCIQLLFIL